MLLQWMAGALHYRMTTVIDIRWLQLGMLSINIGKHLLRRAYSWEWCSAIGSTHSVLNVRQNRTSSERAPFRGRYYFFVSSPYNVIMQSVDFLDTWPSLISSCWWSRRHDISLVAWSCYTPVLFESDTARISGEIMLIFIKHRYHQAAIFSIELHHLGYLSEIWHTHDDAIK